MDSQFFLAEGSEEQVLFCQAVQDITVYDFVTNNDIYCNSASSAFDTNIVEETSRTRHTPNPSDGTEGLMVLNSGAGSVFSRF